MGWVRRSLSTDVRDLAIRRHLRVIIRIYTASSHTSRERHPRRTTMCRHTLLDMVPRPVIQSTGRHGVSERRRQYKVACCGIDSITDNDHPGASDEVARPLLVSEALPRPLLSATKIIVAAGPDLARKASEPYRDTCYPLLYLSWHG